LKGTLALKEFIPGKVDIITEDKDDKIYVSKFHKAVKEDILGLLVQAPMHSGRCCRRAWHPCDGGS